MIDLHLKQCDALGVVSIAVPEVIVLTKWTGTSKRGRPASCLVIYRSAWICLEHQRVDSLEHDSRVGSNDCFLHFVTNRLEALKAVNEQSYPSGKF